MVVQVELHRAAATGFSPPVWTPRQHPGVALLMLGFIDGCTLRASALAGVRGPVKANDLALGHLV
jgi:hypothetical protein